MNIRNAISKAKNKLILSAKKNGVCENFGQDEVRKIEEKFIDSSLYTKEMNQNRFLLNEFDEWCMNYY